MTAMNYWMLDAGKWQKIKLRWIRVPYSQAGDLIRLNPRLLE